MVMYIGTMKATCPSCGWSMIVPHQGDVILPSRPCERCGNSVMILAKAGLLDRLNPVTFIMDRLRK